MVHDQLRKSLRRANEKLESQSYVRAKIGSPDGLTLWGDRDGFVYAQIRVGESTAIRQIRCNDVTPQMGLEVMCRKSPIDGVWEAVMMAPDTGNAFLGGLGSANVGQHAWTHMFLAPDTDWVQGQRMMPLLVQPTNPPSLSIEVRPFWYIYDGDRAYYAGETVDLTSYVPSGTDEQRLIVIDFDPDAGEVSVTADTAVETPIEPADGHPFAAADITALSLGTGYMQVQALRLYEDQTEIVWSDYVEDLRTHYHIPLITLDTANITYTPAVDTDWDGDADPGDLDDAVDQLAERVDDLEGAVPDAGDVTYTPGTLTDWDSDADPGDLDDALDQLAERVDDLEGATIDAGDVTYTPTVLTDWDSDADPGDLDDALDQLAERVDDLEFGGGGGGISVAVIADQKSQDTDGGTFTSGSWQTRDLNTEISDADGIVTISSNRFTPSSGTYWLMAFAPTYQVDKHMTRLYNHTQSSEVEIMTSDYAYQLDGTTSWCKIFTVFEADGSDEYEIQHWCTNTKATFGFGRKTNLGVETYTVVQLIKIA